MVIGRSIPFKLVDQTPTKDANGNWVGGETTVLRGYAELITDESSRSFQNNQNLIDKFFELKFRYRGDISINADTRLIMGGNRYTVQGIRKEGMKNFHWIITLRDKSYG